MKNFFRGAATALITPFEGRNRARGVNYSCLKRLLTRQFAAGVSAVVILGTTGESATVTEKERREIFNFCMQERNGFYGENCGDRRAKLIFGCGANDTRAAAKHAAAAQKLGADGVLAVTPYYNKCTQRACFFTTARLPRRAICRDRLQRSRADGRESSARNDGAHSRATPNRRVERRRREHGAVA